MKSFGTAAAGAALLACAVPFTLANAQTSPSTTTLAAGQCLPMAEMNAALRAQGQRTMIIGNRSAVQERDATGNPTRVTESAEVITSNADGSLGYNLAGNRPREEASTEMCVGARLTNVRLFDARQTEIPRAAYLGGTFNTLVDQNAALGTRPMVVADTVFANDNGGTRLGRPIVLFGNMEVRGASLVTYSANLEPARLALMVDTDYTQAAMDQLASAAHLMPGQCLPMADMNAALRAEGQRTIVIGDRASTVRTATQSDGPPDSYGLTPQDYSIRARQLRDPEGRLHMASFLRFTQPQKSEAERAELLENMALIARTEAGTESTRALSGPLMQRWVNTITSNEDGSRGYQLEGNLPSNQPSTQVCVRYLLTAIQVFDPRRTGNVPQAVMLGGSFNAWVTANAANGVRPMIVARSLVGEVGNLRHSQSIVIMGDLNNRVGLLGIPNESGPQHMRFQFENLAFTTVGAARLEATHP